jgi:hypothetical protein
MLLILAVLLLAVILGASGFTVHFLWVIAAVVFLFWLAGVGFARGSATGARRRWYNW